MKGTRPPCRFEQFQVAQRQVVLDVAHNVPAFERLLGLLKSTYGEHTPLRFVCGFSADKDIYNVVHMIFTSIATANIHFVQSTYRPRCATIEEIRRAVINVTFTNVLMTS
jgi:folylpolyglutamate synthase/dihydropteroate synthase